MVRTCTSSMWCMWKGEGPGSEKLGCLYHILAVTLIKLLDLSEFKLA